MKQLYRITQIKDKFYLLDKRAGNGNRYEYVTPKIGYQEQDIQQVINTRREQFKVSGMTYENNTIQKENNNC